jgi:hypothetical protein
MSDAAADASMEDGPMLYAHTVEHVVHVRGVSPEVTWRDVVTFFADCGVLGGGPGAVVLTFSAAGDAWVALGTAEGKDLALRKSGERLGKR